MTRSALGLSFLVLTSQAWTQAPEIASTELQSFVSNPAVVIENEELLAKLVTRDSTILIYSLEASDRSSPGSSMHGARIELSNNAWRDSIYLDTEQFAALAWDIEGMAGHQRDFRDESAPRAELRLVGNQGYGTAECRMPESPQRILCPTYRTNQGFETFVLDVYGSAQSFPIPADELQSLASVLRSAADEFESEELFSNGSVLELSVGSNVGNEDTGEGGSAFDMEDSSAARGVEAEAVSAAQVPISVDVPASNVSSIRHGLIVAGGILFGIALLTFFYGKRRQR